VAKVGGYEGFAAIKSEMGAFILAVVLALFLQSTWYLLRNRSSLGLKPLDVLRGTRDALVMAF